MRKNSSRTEDQTFQELKPLNNNDPELEAAYLKSYPTDEIPAGAVLMGTIEALAFPVEIFKDTDGTYLSRVQER
ncbi:hypothetical protein [Anaerocolumna xylanovorans]|uniref:Uncharacterized protein n=1 Tax=Anaerocolumna xylanovorans DSM 12503 TaxID=1121345 RepID=A0A1M7YBV0_9FIRM|nr:hypothetical protein [Anaerocolumna xylanovorans]SHO50105.1 hypothetical protein SAMN02745217_02589 [Anaerocolumna xylanovorans DSM 12503]